MFQVNFGVRQGSVLSTFLFAVYLDDLAKSCHTQRNIFIILYADDILLLAPSVCELDALHKQANSSPAWFVSASSRY